MQAEDERPNADATSPPDPVHAARRVLPVSCAQCGVALPTDGDAGTCRQCGLAFDRRERLFDTYGPEAFLDEPVVLPKAKPSAARYRRAIILSVVAVLSVPIAQYCVRRGVLDADRVPFVIFLFVIAIFEWIRVSGGGALDPHDQDSTIDDFKEE